MSAATTGASRIAPAEPPYHPEIAARFDALMPPGIPPLVLFRTLARDKRLIERFMGGGLLDKGHLTLRQREIVIDRVTARCGSEYEWGVHVAFFAKRGGPRRRASSAPSCAAGRTMPAGASRTRC